MASFRYFRLKIILPTTSLAGGLAASLFLGEKKEKLVKDAVHGNIKIPPLCVAIMDTPQFQRLRDIKQLGGAPYVYPGGSHSRFEHSLGVCHLAGRLMRKLQEQQSEGINEKQRISDKDVLCVQIAGLCHDMGHGPFSHAFDMQFLPKFNGAVEHEELSCRMIDYMLKEEGLMVKFQQYELDETDIEFIKRLIMGSKGEKDDGRGTEKSFLYEVVNNKTNGVDVDKWDYFVRDCHHLGIGTDFDYDRLIESSRVVDKVKKEDGTIEKLKPPHICWRDKEIFNIMQMFHTRYTLHKKVYQHRVIKAVEMMIMEALVMANEVIKLKEGSDMTMAESINDMEAYSKLTDSVFYQIKNYDDKGLNEDQRKKLKEAQELLLNVERRKLYMFVAQSAPIKRKEKVKDRQALEAAILEDLVKEMPKFGTRLRVQVVVYTFGMTQKDGLYQFTKDSPDVATVADTKNFSLLGFPETLFTELVVLVYLVPSENRKADLDDTQNIASFFNKQDWEKKIDKLLEDLRKAAAST